METNQTTKETGPINKGSVEDIPKLLDKLSDAEPMRHSSEGTKIMGTVEDIPKLLDTVGNEGAGRRFSTDFQQKIVSATSFVGSLLPSPSQVVDKVGEATSSVTKEVGKVTSSMTKEMEKVTHNMSQVLKDGVAHAPLVNSFNKEQEEFIKSQEGRGKEGDAPWKGYQNEEELKVKIMTLSGDKRNLTRSPPAGVKFDFEYNTFASYAVVLLREDPQLQKLRYELVPKVVKEDQFWRNYFYRVELVKQQFLLLETDIGKKDEGPSNVKIYNTVDEEEWEADLEGELSEFDVVGADQVDSEEVDNQIQKMLDAENGKK